MIYGAVLIAVIRFAPRGLVGAFIDARERLARRFAASRPPVREAIRG
jgi:hypothetical protein